MNVVLGTMTFGEQIFKEESGNIIDEFLGYGYNRLDTAYVYNDGQSEELIGEYIRSNPRSRLIIDTKANPRITGKLDSASINYQIEGSLKRLGTEYVDCFYLHFPDKTVPVEEQLETVNSLYQRGLIKEFGLSNFPLELVEKIYMLCEDNGWIYPTVYEGLYNPLSRKAEELNSILVKYNISFFAYNPLAGGLLTNKYGSYNTSPLTGRFTLRPNYQKRYWKESYFEAADMLKKECGLFGLDITEASLRWMVHSSMLRNNKGDSIIIGVSKKDHLKSNLDDLKKTSLPEKLLHSFDRAWEICKADSPNYY